MRNETNYTGYLKYVDDETCNERSWAIFSWKKIQLYNSSKFECIRTMEKCRDACAFTGGGSEWAKPCRKGVCYERVRTKWTAANGMLGQNGRPGI